MKFKELKEYIKNFKPVFTRKCLHCEEGKPMYCESCYQKLLTENLELRINKIETYNTYQEGRLGFKEDPCNNHITQIDTNLED